jgi:hypothetical protein
VADYKRRRKRSGKSYTARGPYVQRLKDKYGGPRLGGGGYSGQRNYIRAHDFKYEREPTSKLPKTETRYEVIERPSTESYPPTLYRPELEQASVEKAVGQAMERYLRNDSERSPQVEGRTETQQELDVGANPLVEGTTGEAKAPEIDATRPVEVDRLSPTEGPQETNVPIEPTPDPLESYEIPITDLELLLVELDANPLEARPEKNIEPRPAEEQQ